MADKDEGGSPPEPPKKDPPLKFSTVPPSGELPANHFRHAYDYLAERGIDQALCGKLGFRIQPAGQWFTETYPGSKSTDPRIAIKFTHYDYKGQEIEWNSVKFIQPKKSGLVFVEDNKPTRSSKKGELIHAYLCPLNNWRDLHKGQKIYLCESVIKAVNVSTFGFHSIGLNGVAAFASAKKRVDLLPEIKDLPWARLDLQPVIMYDSDYAKYDITRAYETLANKLVNLCKSKQPIYLPLDPGPDGDWGFDDARHTLGDKWALEFLEGAGFEVALDPMKQALYFTNESYIIAKKVNAIIHLETSNVMKESEFRNVHYANKIVWTEEGKAVPVAKSWMQWENRNECEGLEYMPGGEQVHNNNFNLWQGMGCEPAEGNVDPWLDILNNNIRSAEERKYLIQWCAYPVQNLGAKLHSTVVLVGPQGVGKSLFGKALGAVYGRDNYTEVNREGLNSSFNSVWVARQLVVIEEMRGDHKGADKAFMGKLKEIITSDQHTVKMKHVKEYIIENRTNFLFTTNDADALAFEGGDRRFFVGHFDPIVDHYRDPDYWNKFGAWLSGTGPAALHHYLLNVDMEGFDPVEPAPETSYKEIMEEAAYSGPEAWVKQLHTNPGDLLPSDRALWTSRELATIYHGGDLRDGPAAAKAFSNYMLNRGFEQANNHTNIGNRKMGKAKYWIVRDRDNVEWKEHGYCIAHLQKYSSELPDSKF